MIKYNYKKNKKKYKYIILIITIILNINYLTIGTNIILNTILLNKIYNNKEKITSKIKNIKTEIKILNTIFKEKKTIKNKRIIPIVIGKEIILIGQNNNKKTLKLIKKNILFKHKKNNIHNEIKKKKK